MTNKFSTNKITSADIDWTSVDPENGLQWSGQSIQEFIRGSIGNAEGKFRKYDSFVYDAEGKFRKYDGFVSDVNDKFIEYDEFVDDAGEKFIEYDTFVDNANGKFTNYDQFIDDADEKFIRYDEILDQTDDALEEVNNKIGASHFQDETMFYFRTQADREAWLEDPKEEYVLSAIPLTLSGLMRQILFENPQGTLDIYFLNTSKTAPITVNIISQQKGMTDDTWQTISEDFYVTARIDRNDGNWSTLVDKQLVVNGNPFTVDVRKHLVTGKNRVEISARGVTSMTNATVIFNVSLTSMYLSPANFAWNVPFHEGSTYNLGGMNIGGAIDKDLHVVITGDNYYASYIEKIGTATYVTNAYYYKGIQFPEIGSRPTSGVYEAEVWLDANGLESQHLVYNIICVSAADKNTAQFIAINEIPEKATNYADNLLFKYSIYNAGSTIGSPSVSAHIGNDQIINETLEGVATATINEYIANVEYESEDTDLMVSGTAVYGNSQLFTLAVDNSAAFPATKDAVFYMNAASRNNQQSNRESIVNQVDNSEISVDWTRMVWIDGTDGWTVDDKGMKCLRVPASSKASIYYSPLGSFSGNKTIDLTFKVSNVADYDSPIISICDDPSKKDFIGIKITPRTITLHSLTKNSADMVQSYNYKDEEIVNITISIMRNYKVSYGNFAFIYVNGVKKCVFSFTNADSWVVPNNMQLGSDNADLFLYKMRVYNKAFSWSDVMMNYINSLPSASEKQQAFDKMMSVVDDSYQIEYEKVKGLHNTMVIEMLDEAELPHYGLDKEYKAQCNLDVDLVDKNWAFRLEDCRIEGQGTTSMNYWIWNLRWRLDKSEDTVNVIYSDGTESTGAEVWFDGVDAHPIMNRITAKKNFASSMQSHKMGATAAFNDLHDIVVGKNEAEGRVAVFQYPIYGFLKLPDEGNEGQYIYKFVGFYTIGPDKGDKKTFGYKHKNYKDTVIHLEGTDHSIKGVGMEYPYSQMKYVSSEESLCADKGNNQYDAAWEVGASGSAEEEADIQAYLDQEFKPAYEVAYNNSTMIMGTDVPLEVINSNVDAWGLTKDEDGHAYQRFDFWIDGEYDLYYLSLKTGKYEKNGINLLTQLNISRTELEGKTIKDKNELFKQKRRERFKTEMANYWHFEDTIFCYCFVTMFGATDNFKKNSYPYKFPLLADGGRWRWRQDDLDTLFDIDNQGHASKTYSIEAHDWTDSSKSAYVFKGEDSVFWRLVDECFPIEIKEMGKRILQAMYDLGTGSDTLTRLLSFFKKYFWDVAQNYFTKSAYNLDTESTYEDSYPHYISGTYNVDVNPLEQALGSHYEAEIDWVERRLIYIMSKFSFGPFNQYTDTSLGRVNFRTQLAQSFTITPAMDMYPVILSGQGAATGSNDRVLAGDSYTINGAGGTNTNVYIMAANYLQDIGDLSTLAVDASLGAELSISGKRLSRIKVGDEDASKVTSNLATLTIGSCPSLVILDARNLKSLTGSVDLTNCPRLQKALFEGTAVNSVQLADGSKITELSLSDNTTTIAMMNLKYLENVTYGDLAKVQFFRLENCAATNAFELLKQMYESDDSALRNVRILGFAYTGDADDLTMLSNLVNDVDKNGNPHIYNGIDAEGYEMENSIPVIEGTLDIESGGVYADDVETLKAAYGENLTINLARDVYYYYRFKDPKVTEICANTWGDGVGTTEAEIKQITTIGTAESTSVNVFAGEQAEGIQTFDEFYDFEKVINVGFVGSFSYIGNLQVAEDKATTLKYQFSNNTTLKSIKLPKNMVTLGSFAFLNCTSLENVEFSGNAFQLGQRTFGGTTNLKTIRMPGLSGVSTSVNTSANTFNIEYASPFYGSGIESILDFGKITTTKVQIHGNTSTPYLLRNCQSLKEVVFPETLKTLSQYTFYDCPMLTTLYLPQSLTTLDQQCMLYLPSLEIEDLNLPNLTSFGSKVFHADAKVRKISNLGKITTLTVATASPYHFGNPTYLKSITLPSTMKTLPNNLLRYYTDLEEVIVSEGTTTIGQYTLANLMCEVDLPDSITTIQDYAFDSNLGLKKIDLPNLHNISGYAFKGCSNLETINLTPVQSISSYAFSGTPESLQYVDSDGNVMTELRLPNITTFQQNTFKSTDEFSAVLDLGKIVTLSTLISGDTRFGKISTIKRFVIPNTVQTLQYYCFTRLTSCVFVFPDREHSQITTISGSDSSSLGFGSSCTVEGDSLFLPKLKTMGAQFGSGLSIKNLYIDALESIAVTHSTSVNMFGNKSTLELVDAPMLKIVGGYLFYNYNALTTVNIPSVTSIGVQAFYGCSQLSDESLATIPSGCAVSKQAFRGCTSLSRVDMRFKLSDTTFSISQDSAPTKDQLGSHFADGKYTEITIADGMQISTGMCADTTTLTTVNLPESVTTLPDRCFGGCASLRNINLKNITMFGSAALRNAVKPMSEVLNEVDFTKVTHIGQTVFNVDNTELHAVVQTMSLPSLREIYSYGLATLDIQEITDLNSLEKLGSGGYTSGNTGVFKYGTFGSNKKLKLSLPPTLISMQHYAFSYYSEGEITIPEYNNITSFHISSFLNTHVNVGTSLEFPNLIEISSTYNAFTPSKYYTISGPTKITNLGKITKLTTYTPNSSDYVIFRSDTVETIVFPDTLTKINCRLFDTVVPRTLVFRSQTPPSMTQTFAVTFGTKYTNTTFYVPDASVSAYKSASKWSTVASQIKSISEWESSQS